MADKYVIDFLLPYSGAHLQLWSSFAFGRLVDVMKNKSGALQAVCTEDVTSALSYDEHLLRSQATICYKAIELREATRKKVVEGLPANATCVSEVLVDGEE